MHIKSFDGQREDEEIIAVWRQHPWVLSRSALIGALIIAVGSLPEAIWSPSWGWGAVLIFAAIALIFGGIRFYLWFNTIYILTNQRIMAICQKGVMYRTTNEVPLQNIQNVCHTKKGLSQMLLDFGEVEIETSGAKTAMIIKNIERPYKVQQRILARQEKE